MTTEPYYQDEWVTLYHGDCREITLWLDTDVLVTDPPYGRSWRQSELRGHYSANLNTGIANDKTTALRDTALALWGTEKPAVCFGDLMSPPPAGVKLVAVYRKPADAGLRGAIAGVRRDVEAIYLLNRWASGIGGRSALFATNTSNIGASHGLVARSGGHPHTKPADVMGDLLALTAGAVADPFAGSGSTLVAAKMVGRSAVGIELEERYCEIAARRLSQDVLDFAAAEPAGGVA